MKSAYLGFTWLLVSVLSSGQQAANDQSQQAAHSDSNRITVRGCLRTERQSYILIANRTGVVYALQGVGNKLNQYLRKEVEVTGEAREGSRRTGIRPEKSGSNPSDTVHAVDGVPLEIHDVNKDIRVIAKHCKAADAQ